MIGDGSGPPTERELRRAIARLGAADVDGARPLGWIEAIEIINGTRAPESVGLTFAEAADEMARFWTANGEDVPSSGLDHYRQNAADAGVGEDVPLRSDDAAKAVAYLLAISADGADVPGRRQALAFLIDDDDATDGDDGREVVA